MDMFGTSHFVIYGEVVLSSEVEMIWDPKGVLSGEGFLYIVSLFGMS